jgi:hypothetical protein
MISIKHAVLSPLSILLVGFLASPQSLATTPQPSADAAPIGTRKQTCRYTVGTGDGACDVTVTATLEPTPVEDPCPTTKVRITGTIVCDGNSCSFEELVCGDSGGGVSFSCNGTTYDVSDMGAGNTWNKFAKGTQACSTLTIS